MEPFTDEDLKELKNYIQSPAAFFNNMDNRLRPLITRLEAAEDCIDESYTGECKEILLNAWRKAAGK